MLPLMLQARLTAKSHGASDMVDEMRTIWGNMMRSSLGYKAFQIGGSMSAEELYGELENKSRIGALETR